MGTAKVLLQAALLLLTLAAGAQAFADDQMEACVTCAFGQRAFDGEVNGPSNASIGQLADISKHLYANIISENNVDPRNEVTIGESNKWLLPVGATRSYRMIEGKNKEMDLESYADANLVLVSPCLAITNVHAVVGEKIPQEVLPQGLDRAEFHKYLNSFVVKASFGSTEQGKAMESFIGTPVASTAGHIIGQTRYDHVVIHFKDCPGKKYGWMDLSSSEKDLAGKQVEFYGHTAKAVTDSKGVIQRDPDDSKALKVKYQATQHSCEILAYDKEHLKINHSCSTEPSASFSVLIDPASKTVLGMHTSVDFPEDNKVISVSDVRSNLGKSGNAVPAFYFKLRYEQAIKKDIENFGRPNPAKPSSDDRVLRVGQQSSVPTA